MKYAWVGGPAPAQKTYQIMDAAAKRQSDLKAKIKAEQDRLEASKKKDKGVMTKEKKDRYAEIDKAKKQVEADNKFKLTEEEEAAAEEIKQEKVFQDFLKNFNMKESELP